MGPIDLVVPWVDGSDPKWQEERNKYSKYNNTNPGYYQDWGWMHYWFRCVEQNLPWIRTIYFVTYGHVPAWLDLNHPKLQVVRHEDYIPEDFLPTFGGGAFVFNLHKITGLSETFIYAEDDIFFIGKQKPTDFFSEEGLPKDFLWLKPVTEQFQGDFAHLVLNNMLVINKHFETKSLLETSDKLIFSDNYPQEAIEDNNRFMTLKKIPGFKETHLAYSLLKSTFDEIWEKENLEMYKCCKRKFRSIANMCSMVLRDWQLASGKFSPYYQEGRFFTDTSDPDLEQMILCESTKMICINESGKQGYSQERADEICSFFEKRFSQKSTFELD